MQIAGDIRIGDLPFRLLFQASRQESIISAAWNAEEGGEISPALLSQHFSNTPLSVDIPEAVSHFDLSLTKIAFDYHFKAKRFTFLIATKNYGALTISSHSSGLSREFCFKLEINSVFQLNKLPVIGEGLKAEDYIRLGYFSVTVAREKKAALGADLEVGLFGQKIPFELLPSPDNRSMPLASDVRQESISSVKWLDVNKDVGPLHLARLGFAMGDGCVTVQVDGGLRLSVLLLEFLGLYLSIPLKKSKSVDFGIQGLAVTVSRPPLLLSGGLYVAKEKKMSLYTGEISVRVGNFQLTALGSYGVFDDGDPSLFIFLLLNYPLGGPSIFYITGLAGGFGYNRTIILPAEVKDVKKFPFVAAAMQQGPLKKEMSPGEVLKAMNASIKPQRGQYFASVGVRFTSFGLVDAFLLANVMFGDHLEISLLGLASVSLPPRSSTKVAYAELALKVVIAPDCGVVSILGVLTSESFVLDKGCKLRGGFAFVTWFGKNEHSGDFILTLGGYREGFLIPHYPKVDRIGVDWKISKNLSLTASFYFALTPSCLMMGGCLALTFEMGRLKAWFRARVDFFMQWKPFAYSLSLYVSIGASFRWDFFPFYRTFTLELSANLDLWGPPFGGKAHVKWWVISFTISFGEGKALEIPIKWPEFAESFLPQAKTGNANEAQYIGIRVADGIVRENRNSGEKIVSAKYLSIEIISRLPCSSLRLEDEVRGEYGGLGVVPMGTSHYTSELTVKVRSAAGAVVRMQGKAILSNLPRALWAQRKPEINDTDTLQKNVPTGIVLCCPDVEPEGILPEYPAGSYDVAELCKNEMLPPLIFSWTHPSPIRPKIYPDENRLRQISDSIVKTGGLRYNCLSMLAKEFGVYREEDLKLDRWGENLDEILFSTPEIQAIGTE